MQGLSVELTTAESEDCHSASSAAGVAAAAATGATKAIVTLQVPVTTLNAQRYQMLRVSRFSLLAGAD